MNVDVLIIGSGIAGLSVALKLAEAFPSMEIAIVTKKGLLESNTNLAQGGIAIPVDPHDSVEEHVADTLRAGAGLCDQAVVHTVIADAQVRLGELIAWGITFDARVDGSFDLGKEGGHSANRIVHHKDATGNCIAETLVKKIHQCKNVKVLANHFAYDIVTTASRCIGVRIIDPKGITKSICSRITILSTGGIGQVYAQTTNPLIATGDGIAMARRAGAQVRDMEFIQFHPTAFALQDQNPTFLISEAVRGFGGHLTTAAGDRFAFKYDTRGELASRDIVSKAIFEEMRSQNHPHVFLDCRHLSATKLALNFPNILAHCREKGFDLTTDLIPVAPAAHYLCGGISTDLSGKTSIENLYAVGECAGTGLHGANRLASNSLLEAIAFAHYIFQDVSKIYSKIRFIKIRPQPKNDYTVCNRFNWIGLMREELRGMMTRNVGIVRSNIGLHEAHSFINLLKGQLEELYSVSEPTVELCEFRNMVEVSGMIVSSSKERKVNCGAFFNKNLL